MGFYGDIRTKKKRDKYKRIDHTTLDRERAKQLYQTLKKHHLVQTLPNLIRWAYFLHVLDHQLKKEGVLQKVLDWYCSHAGERYTPRVQSAKIFKEKFDQIHDAMKFQTEHRELNPEEIKITPRTKKFLKKFTLDLSFKWPKKKFYKTWPGIAQVSLDNGYLLKQLLKRILKRLKKQSNSNPSKYYPRYEVTKYLYDQYFIDPQTFTKDWCVQNFARLCEWDEWDFNPKSIMLSWDRKQFRRTIVQLVQCPEEIANAFVREVRREASKL